MNPEQITKFMIELSSKFDEKQMHYASHKFYLLAASYADYLIAIGRPICGVKPLQVSFRPTRILRLQLAIQRHGRTQPDAVCPLHREFAKLCLKAQCYPNALNIISQPITNLRSNTGAMDVIVYNYYRGLLFTGL